MKQLIARLTRSLAKAVPPACPSDPFAHPALARMTPRDLADLPFPRPGAAD